MAIICVDFDDTLMDTSRVPFGKRLGPPMAGAVSAMVNLASRGYTLVVFTVRGGTPESRKAVEDWCDYFKIPFSTVTNIKVNADAYIDDKGIKFTSWSQTLNDIERLK
jgi:hypothetical protein